MPSSPLGVYMYKPLILHSIVYNCCEENLEKGSFHKEKF